MAIVGRLYRANNNVSRLSKEHPIVVLVIDRRPSGYDKTTTIVTVEYLVGEQKNRMEEKIFHLYFNLLEEEA